MKKNIKIIIGIWLAVEIFTALLFSLVNFIVVYGAGEVSINADVVKEFYDAFDDTDSEELRQTLTRRAIFDNLHSDEKEKYTIKNAFFYKTEAGSNIMDSGTWGVVKEGFPDENMITYKKTIALWNAVDMLKNGNGHAIYDFIKDRDDDLYVKVDKYVIKEHICYPLELSVYLTEGDELLQTFECYSAEQFAENEITCRDDVILFRMKEDLCYALDSENSLVKYGNNLGEKIDYSKDYRKDLIIPTPFFGLRNITDVSNGYAAISLELISFNNFLWPYHLIFGVGFTVLVWTVIGIKIKKEKRTEH